MPRHGWLAFGVLSRRVALNSGPVYARFVVEKLALEEGLLGVIRPFPVSTIPLTFHTHFRLNTNANRMSSWRSLATLKQRNASLFASHWAKR